MLRWLLGERVSEVEYLRRQLADERAEKTRMLEEARDEMDRRDRIHRRTVDILTARQDAILKDFVSLADARARAEMEHYRWAAEQRQRAGEVGVPDGSGPVEGVGEAEIDRLAGLGDGGRDREPVWNHSLVAEGHIDLPPEDGDEERAAEERERIRLESLEREREARGQA